MRYLGIDYGTKRVGLALADDELRLPLPWQTVEAGSPEEAAAVVAELAATEQVDLMVVGWPRHLADQAKTSQAERQVKKFVTALRVRTSAQVELEDERLTTAAAISERRAAGVSPKKFDRDSVAAAGILETYLARAVSRKP